MRHFADRLIEAARLNGPLCIGVDPHAGRIPALFGGDTADGVKAWGVEIVRLAAEVGVAAVKPQAGLFERLGPEGMSALRAVCQAARETGLVTILDAKRGDIGSTAEGYAQAYLADDAPFPCDALTVNPYMGLDTLEPFARVAEETGRGLAVLARTSNPGSADFQAKDMGGAPLYARVVTALGPLINRLEGTSGWSSLMLVAGATGPEEARALRALAPKALFLVPGYGAQGAGADDALAGFVKAGNRLEGGVVNASRSVTFPDGAGDAETLETWREIVGGAMRAAKTDLGEAAGAAA
ncbi:MAG: orotidine-5'-phosphate decarboxylase [Pseudomonadota bacterium]